MSSPAALAWESHPTLAADGLEKLLISITANRSNGFGLLGMTGLTAYFGIRDVGAIRPGETVLASRRRRRGPRPGRRPDRPHRSPAVSSASPAGLRTCHS
jgi:hypothetical protein